MMMKKYSRYISNEGWQAIALLIVGLYFPIRAILFWGYGI
jgi:ABC-type uncharacterized transport system permease subunit